MSTLRRLPSFLVGALLVTAVTAAPAMGQSSPAPCAPPAVSDPPGIAIPGGDASKGVAQPGPMPMTAPGVCWIGAIGSPLNGAAIGAIGDTVLAGADTGALIAFAADGGQRWSYQAGDSGLAVRAIALDADHVYVATPTGIISLALADGSEGWVYTVPDNEGALVADTVGAFSASLSGTTLLTTTGATTDGFTVARHLVALDVATGATAWSVLLPDDGPLGRPAANGTIAAIAAGDDVQAFDLASGSAVWLAEHETIGDTVATDVVFTTDKVLAGLTDSSVVALSTADGSLVWRSAPPEVAAAPLGLAANGDDVAYLDTGFQLIAIDTLTGATPWGVTIQASAPFFSFAGTPAITSEGVVVGTTDAMDVATLIAISDTGTELWRSPTEIYGALMSPVVLGGRVYTSAFGLTGGGLLAFGTP